MSASPLCLQAPLSFALGDLKLVCPECRFTVNRIAADPDGTPASPPRSPIIGKCKRHGWIRLIAIDPFTEELAA